MLTSNKSLLNYSKVLDKKQADDPLNLLTAHDLGLVHYNQAKKENDYRKYLLHWYKLIANWAMVIEDDKYWQDWCAERSLVYEKEITDSHIAEVKEELINKVSNEASRAASLCKEGKNCHLDALFHLEIETIRLLKGFDGLLLSPEGNIRIYCGYLQAKQLALFSAVEDFFQDYTLFEPETTESIDFIFSFIKNDRDKILKKKSIKNIVLRFSFSQLGIAYIYLKRGEPQNAIEVISHLRCPSCENQLDQQECLSNNTLALPALCHKDCVEFRQLNPSYNNIQNGHEVFYRHGIQLYIAAFILNIYQALLEKEINITFVLVKIKQILDLSGIIQMNHQIREMLTPLLFGWADELCKKDALDEAIQLMEGISGLGEKELWEGKCAGLYNLRGVKRSNEEYWEGAVSDLRKACKLKASVPYYWKNLQNALYGYANSAYMQGDNDLYTELRREAEEIQQGYRQKQKTDISATLENKKKNIKEERLILDEVEQINPYLFDEYGYLKYEMFSKDGIAVLEQAKEHALKLGDPVIYPRALLLALVHHANGETIRLFSLQGVTGEQVPGAIEAGPAASEFSTRLKEVKKISQFDMWFTVLEILSIALDIARYGYSVIGESHLLYGMLALHCLPGVFEKAGVDMNIMLQHAAWR